MSAKLYRIKLSEVERLELETIRDQGSRKASIFKKALALLLCDEGPTGPSLADSEILPVVAISPSSLMRLRQRCCEVDWFAGPQLPESASQFGKGIQPRNRSVS